MTQDKLSKTDKNNATELKVPCEVYSRVVGYLRPVQNWNDGKRQEFAERKTFQVPERDAG